MRYKLMAIVMFAMLAGTMTLWLWDQQTAHAQDKESRQRFEYKVVYSSIAHVEITESRKIDGKQQEITHGPKQSAETMTKQFNALAAEGWEYVGPAATTGSAPIGKLTADDVTKTTGVLSVFRRVKK